MVKCVLPQFPTADIAGITWSLMAAIDLGLGLREKASVMLSNKDNV